MVYNIFVLFVFFLLYLYYKGGYRKEKYINAIFFMMWVIFAIEYYTTKDYPVYYENFYNNIEHWEPLYTFLMHLFRPLGFISFNAAVSAFEIFTLCFLYKKIVPPRYRWIGIVFLILNNDYLLIFMNLKRQFFAMACGLWVAYYSFCSENKRRYLYALIALVCAINIHTSGYVCAVFILLSFINKRMNKPLIIGFFVIYAVSFTFSLSAYAEYISQMMALTGESSDYYMQYLDQQAEYEKEGIGRNLTLVYRSFDILLFSLLLIYNKKATDKEYKFFLCSIIYFILGNILLGNFFRINLYFKIMNIISIPLILSKIRIHNTNQLLFYAYTFLCLAIPARLYYNTMFSDKYNYMTVKYKNFYTIFHDEVDKKDYMPF